MNTKWENVKGCIKDGIDYYAWEDYCEGVMNDSLRNKLWYNLNCSVMDILTRSVAVSIDAEFDGFR